MYFTVDELRVPALLTILNYNSYSSVTIANTSAYFKVNFSF